jgi:hypothetical protein
VASRALSTASCRPAPSGPGGTPADAIALHHERRRPIVDTQAHLVERARDPRGELGQGREQRVGRTRGIPRGEVLDPRRAPHEGTHEAQVDRLGLESLARGLAQARLGRRIGEVATLGQERGRLGGAQHEEVARDHPARMDPDVARQRALHILRDVERRPLVPDRVVDLRLVDVMRPARIGIVMHAHEQVGCERGPDPGALGQIGAQR